MRYGKPPSGFFARKDDVEVRKVGSSNSCRFHSEHVFVEAGPIFHLPYRMVVKLIEQISINGEIGARLELEAFRQLVADHSRT
eukprot:3436394-Rhodomonas_salina.1